MLSLKLVRSLVLGETINNPLLLNQNHHDPSHDEVHSHTHDDIHTHQRSSSRRESKNGGTKTKTPLLIFLPTREVVRDTYRLATIARDMGMDLYPSPSLSHVIFLWPSSPSSSSSSSSSSSPSVPSLWSSSSSSWSFSGDAIALPFPSLTTASTAQLRSFVGLSKGLFKLAFCSFSSNSRNSSSGDGDNASHWDCSSLSLYSRLSGDRIDSMDGFCRALAGMGWTLFKTKNNPSLVSSDGNSNGVKSVHLFRKVDSNKLRASQSNGGGEPISGEYRIRELRLPPLDFRNAPLRILQYVMLMTDDLFYLA
ncbi:uncharacterized protein DDB_G0271670 [Macadamia integrifolia]|uniref:uncharacterized protein DDB_G0271670 n=1 Tax=Macadamia integrifolia TaxID=60698 RepID=UPI001C4F5F59|nr:uncharacterized protein DDB_G0271670 [Macadamia integrifolia]